MKKLIFVALLVALSSCKKTEEETAKKKKNVVAPHIAKTNDLIILDSATDTIIVMDHDGNFKKVLYRLEQPNSVTLSGLAWLPETGEILTISNHTTNSDDKILAISAKDGSVRTFVQNADLASTVFSDIAVLTDGDVLVTEANVVERFTSLGSRVANAMFPTPTLHTTPTQMAATSNGGFLLCSTGTDRVQFYDVNAVAGAFATSAVAIPALAASTDVTGCYELRNGEIAVSFSGTNDALVILNAGMTAEVARFKNSLVLSTPRAIAQGHNGKIYVLDSALNSLVILDEDANYLKTVTDFLATPTHIITIPE